MTSVRTFFGSSIQRKLILAFLAVVFVFAAIVFPIAYFAANAALSTEASEAIRAVASVGEAQFLQWIEDLRLNITSYSRNDTTVSAARALSNSIDTSQELGLNSNERLQNLRNTFLGQPDLLDAVDLSSPYRSVHERFHPFFQDLAEVYGYSDVLLVNDEGLVVYSVRKNDEVFTSLVNGPYTATSLGNVVAQVLAAGEDGESLITFADFTDYAPSSESTAFLAATIYDGSVFRGVLVFGIPLESIDNLVTLRTGFGNTGEAYVVGTDHLPRSSVLSRSLRAIDATSISTDAVNIALNGGTGIGYTSNYRGIEVLSAWQPVVIEEANAYGSSGVTWALISEIQASEALAPARDLLLLLGIAFLIGTVAALFLSFNFAGQITNPIRNLTESVKKVSDGEFDLSLTVQSQDETGVLGRAFLVMSEKLKEELQDLELRVHARTRDLELAASVSAQVSTELDLGLLLPQIAEVTQVAYDLHHVGVYLYEEYLEQRLVFTSGTGDAGKKMIEGLLSFSLADADSVVARAGRELQVVYIKDVRYRGAASVLFALSGDTQGIPPGGVFGGSIESQVIYDWLPETRSHLALPMVYRGELIGVLDLHSKLEHAFSSDDLNVLLSLAQQLAIAVQNARRYAEEVLVGDELRKVNKMKTEFLARMSHELRTPLNSIINHQKFVHEGYMGDINEEQKEALSNGISSANHLLDLINDILDVSKIEAGLMELFIEDNIPLSKGIAEALTMVRSYLESSEKPVELIEEVAESLPVMSIDQRRIKQVIINLLMNAAKFTAKGHVLIRAFVEQDCAVIEVEDTGVGIDSSELDLIFKPFEQSESGKASAGGTGLGLPISKSLVEAHGGRIEVKSQVGLGSTFSIYLPLNQQNLHSLV